jgi:hypothetical protein
MPGIDLIYKTNRTTSTDYGKNKKGPKVNPFGPMMLDSVLISC